MIPRETIDRIIESARIEEVVGDLEWCWMEVQIATAD